MLLELPQGTTVRLNARGMALHRRLTQSGGTGIPFANDSLKTDEATGTFIWLGDDNGRYAFVRSAVTGREGQLGRDMLRKA